MNRTFAIIRTMTNEQLGQLYTLVVGYNPFLDGPLEEPTKTRLSCVDVLSSPEFEQETLKYIESVTIQNPAAQTAGAGVGLRSGCVPPVSFNYFDNSDVCGNCNGEGCRQCIDELNLSGSGRSRFPLSQMINGCTPPAIENPYKSQGQGGFTAPFRTTSHKLRAF